VASTLHKTMNTAAANLFVIVVVGKVVVVLTVIVDPLMIDRKVLLRRWLQQLPYRFE
jgi:hypothetical protein